MESDCQHNFRTFFTSVFSWFDQNLHGIFTAVGNGAFAVFILIGFTVAVAIAKTLRERERMQVTCFCFSFPIFIFRGSKTNYVILAVLNLLFPSLKFCHPVYISFLILEVQILFLPWINSILFSVWSLNQEVVHLLLWIQQNQHLAQEQMPIVRILF